MSRTPDLGTGLITVITSQHLLDIAAEDKARLIGAASNEIKQRIDFH
jgi:hypothetical protein